MSITMAKVARVPNLEEETPASLYGRISDFEMDAAVHYYARVHGLSISVSLGHYKEFLKYVSMAALYPGQVTPSDQLDEMWHAALIQTRAYEQLCDRIGKFVHHSTEAEPQSGSYKNALEIYWTNFGELHPIWTSPKTRRIDADTPSADEGDCADCSIVGWCSSTS